MLSDNVEPSDLWPREVPTSAAPKRPTARCVPTLSMFSVDGWTSKTGRIVAAEPRAAPQSSPGTTPRTTCASHTLRNSRVPASRISGPPGRPLRSTATANPPRSGRRRHRQRTRRGGDQERPHPDHDGGSGSNGRGRRKTMEGTVRGSASSSSPSRLWQSRRVRCHCTPPMRHHSLSIQPLTPRMKRSRRSVGRSSCRISLGCRPSMRCTRSKGSTP